MISCRLVEALSVGKVVDVGMNFVKLVILILI